MKRIVRKGVCVLVGVVGAGLVYFAAPTLPWASRTARIGPFDERVSVVVVSGGEVEIPFTFYAEVRDVGLFHAALPHRRHATSSLAVAEGAAIPPGASVADFREKVYAFVRGQVANYPELAHTRLPLVPFLPVKSEETIRPVVWPGAAVNGAALVLVAVGAGLLSWRSLLGPSASSQAPHSGQGAPADNPARS